MKFKLLLILQCVLLISGCASLTQQTRQKYPDSESQSCADFFFDLDSTIATAAVKDSEASRIAAYPYLRVNRFLSDFRNEPMDQTTFDEWVDHMQSLAFESWQVELSNLPVLDRQNIIKQSNELFVSNMNFNETIRYCGELLRATDLDEDNKRQHLRNIALVPDEYKTWQRVIGLYPITSLAFRSGINSWHEETNKIYAQALETLTVQGKLIRYAPLANNIILSSLEVSRIIKESSQNKLKIPDPSISNRQKLFDSYAPIFEIDTVTNNDRIGIVEWDKDIIPKINVDVVNVYQNMSYTRLSGQILLQLNYTVWFPSRPKTSTFDLLGGHLDGITWRVTLLPDGNPLLFDSIHNCGCYHLFFPTRRATLLPQESTLDEPVFIAQTLSLRSTDRPIIRIAHSTHYVERVYSNNDVSHKTVYYQQGDSKELRSLELNSGERRSLFGQDGIILSSKRGERYLFWPMGIPNPGAMRQWGHHATAFVGRRHFDDARLFEKYFGIVITPNNNN